MKRTIITIALLSSLNAFAQTNTNQSGSIVDSYNARMQEFNQKNQVTLLPFKIIQQQIQWQQIPLQAKQYMVELVVLIASSHRVWDYYQHQHQM